MDFLHTIDQIEHLVEFSSAFWAGKRHVKEPELLAIISQLRAATASVSNANSLLSLVDELEQLVLNSKKTWWGKRVINEEDFFTQIQRLRFAYNKA